MYGSILRAKGLFITLLAAPSPLGGLIRVSTPANPGAHMGAPGPIPRLVGVDLCVDPGKPGRTLGCAPTSTHRTPGFVE